MSFGGILEGAPGGVLAEIPVEVIEAILKVKPETIPLEVFGGILEGFPK